jgi:alkyl sulfatase BDS1-like metallo-beta-lactamase superfamily hydrolase
VSNPSQVSIEAQVDHLIDTRGGKELLTPVYEDPAFRINDFIHRSGGTTASYSVRTDAGRVIVNTGMGYEAPHHKRVHDAACPGPTTHIITTQAHVDHVGGVALFREPGTVYVAQANNPACQADDARIQALRMRTAGTWFDVSGKAARRIAQENPGVPMTQDAPTPDLLFEKRLALRTGGLDLELISAHGETIDSIIVWMPQHRIAMISNLLGPLFPHFPNLNTLRGDRYRFPEAYLETVRTLRALRPELLITGRATPIAGAELIDACLARLHGAVDFVHRETLRGMNAGVDVWTLMRDIQLPPELRVGEGYGRVAWGVRTIWEIYVGWFKLLSTTEIYPDQRVDALAELVDVAGVEPAVERARELLGRGDAVLAIHLVEGVLARDAGHAGARRLMADAHRHLLDTWGSDNLWADGWLREQLARFEG